MAIDLADRQTQCLHVVEHDGLSSKSNGNTWARTSSLDRHIPVGLSLPASEVAQNTEYC